MGYHLCDTLLDYCDPDDSKVVICWVFFSLHSKRSRAKIFFQILTPPPALSPAFAPAPVGVWSEYGKSSSYMNACFAGCVF